MPKVNLKSLDFEQMDKEMEADKVAQGAVTPVEDATPELGATFLSPIVRGNVAA